MGVITWRKNAWLSNGHILQGTQRPLKQGAEVKLAKILYTHHADFKINI